MKRRSNYSPGAAAFAKCAGLSKNVAVGHRHRPDNPAIAAAVGELDLFA